MNGPDQIESLLNAMKPGDVVASLADGPGAQAVFLARERSAVIKYFGETGVESLAAGFTIGQVMVLAVAFRLGRTVPMVYAVLIDCCSRDGADILRRLASQEYLPLYFYGDNLRRDRTFVIMNELQTLFRDTAVALQTFPAWSAEEFRAAAAKLTSRCPTPEELWAAMKQG